MEDSSKSNRKIILIFIILIVILGIVVIIGLGYLFSSFKEETKETEETMEVISSAEETSIQYIEVEETTEVIDINIDNTEEFVSEDGEQLYQDYTDSNVATEIEPGIYKKNTLDCDSSILGEVINMLELKKVPKPYRIDTVSDNFIYVIQDGRGYGFDFNGNQNIIEDESESVDIESSSEVTQDTEPESDAVHEESVDYSLEEPDGWEEPDVGGDAEDVFIAQNGDICSWVQEQIDGFKSDKVYVHPYEELEDGEWCFRDSRDDEVYIINYDTYGKPGSIEHYSPR